MKKVVIFSILLLAGLAGSQWLPSAFDASYAAVGDVVRIMTMFALSYIMIRVGNEFDIDKSNLRKYGWDYFVAFTAASFPWIFVTLYFVFVLLPPDAWTSMGAWKETLLAGRFAAPTSAGILFSMLAAAGMAGTWLFRKARILAIFDDLDTVLLMIPLKMLMVGLVWQLGITMFVMLSMVAIAYIFLHRVRIPVKWQWVCAYSAVIAGISEIVYKGSILIDDSVPIHIEVLLPAFVLGCIMANPRQEAQADKRGQASEIQLHHIIEKPMERRASSIIAAVFMVLVGLSMPLIFSGEGAVNEPYESSLHTGGAPHAEAAAAAIGSADNIGTITAAQPALPLQSIVIHVLLVTLLSNAGKMFPLLCYRREAHWRERLALSIGMWPRGEVGAGILVISLSYGIGGSIVTIAMLSLATNLLLTGLFIYFVKKLISGKETMSSIPSESV